MRVPKGDVEASYLFAGQFQHVLLLVGLLAGAVYVARPALDGSAWLGVTDRAWFVAAVAVALFQHGYIWVHMYTVEEPDMRVIYG